MLTIGSEDEAITYKNSITAAVVILRFRVFSFHGIFAKPLFNELPSANKNNADYLLVCTNMIKVYKQTVAKKEVDSNADKAMQEVDQELQWQIHECVTTSRNEANESSALKQEMRQ